MTEQYHTLPVSKIKIGENRQRKDLQDINSLAESIKQVGLINPLVVTRDGLLIAGERRFTACMQLGMKEIPVHFMDELSAVEIKVIELEENVKRTDLTWQEHCLAILELHTNYSKQNLEWNITKTGEALSVSPQQIGRYLNVARQLKANNPKLDKITRFSTACNLLARELERQEAEEINMLTDSYGETIPTQDVDVRGINPIQEATARLAVPSVLDIRSVESDILNEDFCTWAENYSGKKFNLIHCDFPYGINHGRSAQGGVAHHGGYEDSEDVYWKLLNALADNWDNIMYPSAHIVFWFSMKHYTATMQFFKDRMPQLTVSAFPLVWHKTDNTGILPDKDRGPRRIYETALLGYTQDRKIVQAVANTYGAPTKKSEAGHVSEKPIPMLKHFFRMLVDENTAMLDPTSGGGTALLAADDMGAQRVQGIELNAEYVKNSRSVLKRQRQMRKISKGNS